MSSLDKPVRARASVQESGHSRDLVRPPLPVPLSAQVIDTHCHLDINDGWPGDEGSEGAWLTVEDALAQATSVGVSRIVQVGCDLPSARWSVECAKAHDAIVATVALHPNEAPRIINEGGRPALEAALTEIAELAAEPRVRAIGETGMDFFRTGEDGRVVQEESFRRHIDLAKSLNKPVVIHDRDSHEAVIRILESEGPPETVVFHCYSGDARMARYCTDRGWYLSFAGTVTFKNAQALRDSVAVAPLDRVLVETDAPYLTPTPFRGRPNASYLIPHTVRVMAQSADVDELTMAQALWTNARRAFGEW
jgi:TatD DNase family protein